ncbi:MAG: endonuclease/exonuclease/phosphatase family protein [Nocardioidaceae bacterium]
MAGALVAVLSATGTTAGAVTPDVQTAPTTVRFATFNATLSDSTWTPDVFVDRLSSGDLQRAQDVAEVVQRTRPDVLLLNEFNHVPGGAAAEAFREHYLRRGQNGAAPIDYPYYYVAAVNTGVASGHDLDNNGTTDTEPDGPFDFDYANDAFGFGMFPGQYGMVVFSRHPIDNDAVRTFSRFRWQDMPGNLMPDAFYSQAEQDVLRLSSKSHWDIPVDVGARDVHLLASHPTPPVFDGPEDRNGKRNHDEIRFWADYVSPGQAGYAYDDNGEYGGLRPGAAFVVSGDQNADPFDGDATGDPADLLLDHPRVNDSVTPESAGGVQDSAADGGVNHQHQGNPAYDTADFGEPPGNIRADYVLPSKDLRIADAGVFWPLAGSALDYLNDVSDHHLVWVDVTVPGA